VRVLARLLHKRVMIVAGRILLVKARSAQHAPLLQLGDCVKLERVHVVFVVTLYDKAALLLAVILAATVTAAVVLLLLLLLLLAASSQHNVSLFAQVLSLEALRSEHGRHDERRRRWRRRRRITTSTTTR
jgi:hypothetical protein